MITINLRDFYPWCKEDIFVDITEEMLEAMKAADRHELNGLGGKRCPLYLIHYIDLL